MKVTDHYGIAPPTTFRTAVATPCANPDLIIGLELETENCQDAQHYADICSVNNLVIEQDGSLRGRNAFEFITRPMKSTYALTALKNFFEYAGFTEDNYSDRCSIHVHVNCTDMELEEISAVAVLYTVFEDILLEFVGHNRDSNIYCIPWNQCRNHLDLVTSFLGAPDSVLKRWVKYTALNMAPLTRYGTIEFRHMYGTSDMTVITQWVNLIGSLVKTARTEGLEGIKAIIKSLNSTSEYEMLFRRVMVGLEYSHTYQQKMEDGVIFAKYSLLSSGTKVPNGWHQLGEVQGAVPMGEVAAGAGIDPIQELADRIMRERIQPVVAGAPRIRPIPMRFEEVYRDELLEDEPEFADLDEELEELE